MDAKAIDIKRLTVIVTWLTVVIVSLIFILSHPSWASKIKPEGTGIAGGVLKKEIEQQRDLISISLIGVTDYQVTELFNDILEKTPGIVKAKRYRFILDPKRPLTCRVDWQVRFQKTSPFELESDIYKMIRKVARDNPKGKIAKLSFQPSSEHRKVFQNIQPIYATSKEIQFHFLQIQDKHANKKPVKRGWRNLWPDRGFE